LVGKEEILERRKERILKGKKIRGKEGS